MRQERIAIVGGSGYVGSAIASRLAQGFKTLIVDQRPPSVDAKIEFRQCDIRDPDSVRKCLEDTDLVIHTAIVQIPEINSEKKRGYEVNVEGTQNVCEAVEINPTTRGLILAGTWHTIGERAINGMIDEGFGYRPDKVEERARLYAISKILQESITRYFDEVSSKIFGIIRLGTVLGERMPTKTVASTFIENALGGKPITPYQHSMYRPMLYVDINDVTRAFDSFARLMLDEKLAKGGSSLHHVANVVYPEPITIRELAMVVRSEIISQTAGKVTPTIEIVDNKVPRLFGPRDKSKFEVDVTKAKSLLGLRELISPQESVRRIIAHRLGNRRNLS
jgi:nucleoside-diphosphate-sugar epimerase